MQRVPYMPQLRSLPAFCLLSALLFPCAASAGPAEDFAQAERAFEAGEFARAESLLTRALAAPNLTVEQRSVSLGRRIEARVALGRYADAVQDATTAVELDPRNAIAYYWRGMARLHSGSADTALRDFSQAILIRPDFADAYVQRGLAAQAAGSTGRPLDDFQKALLINPRLPAAYRARGNHYFYQGNYAAAAEDFRRHEDLAPGDPYNLLRLYLAVARQGKDGRAAIAPAAAKLKLRDWPAPIVALYLGNGSVQQAEAAIPAGTDEVSRGRACEGYFYAGYWQLLAGDRARAAELFKRALETGMKHFNEYELAKAELWRLEVR
jgi:lipoprotein NlpI